MRSRRLSERIKNGLLIQSIFSWEIPNFSSISKNLYSMSFKVGKTEWRLLLLNKRHLYLEPVLSDRELLVTITKNPSRDGWVRNVSATFQLVKNQKSRKNRSSDIFRKQRLKYTFESSTAGCGFRDFIPVFSSEELERGFSACGILENDMVTVSVKVRDKSSRSITGQYGDKFEFGYVGLFNQGATCYLNALLQTLFHITSFRQLIIELPLAHTTGVLHELGVLFRALHTAPHAVSTECLTKSFGWTDSDTDEQHDIGELHNLLFERIESELTALAKAKGTAPAVSALFQEKLETFRRLFTIHTSTHISCVEVDYESQKKDVALSLSVPVGKTRDLEESLANVFSPMLLEGADKYYVNEEVGKQTATIQSQLNDLPPVLFVHFLRSQIHPITGSPMKNTKKLEFPTSLDMSPLLSGTNCKRSPECYKRYVLLAVLAHHGTAWEGHYVAFIRPREATGGESDSPGWILRGPRGKGQWLHFDDSYVEWSSKRDAVVRNFGGNYMNRTSDKTKNYQKSCASMLVYINAAELPVGLPPFSIIRSDPNYVSSEQYHVAASSMPPLYILAPPILRKHLRGTGFTDSTTLPFLSEYAIQLKTNMSRSFYDVLPRLLKRLEAAYVDEAPHQKIEIEQNFKNILEEEIKVKPTLHGFVLRKHGGARLSNPISLSRLHEPLSRSSFLWKSGDKGMAFVNFPLLEKFVCSRGIEFWPPMASSEKQATLVLKGYFPFIPEEDIYEEEGITEERRMCFVGCLQVDTSELVSFYAEQITSMLLSAYKWLTRSGAVPAQVADEGSPLGARGIIVCEELSFGNIHEVNLEQSFREQKLRNGNILIAQLRPLDDDLTQLIYDENRSSKRLLSDCFRECPESALALERCSRRLAPFIDRVEIEGFIPSSYTEPKMRCIKYTHLAEDSPPPPPTLSIGGAFCIVQSTVQIQLFPLRERRMNNMRLRLLTTDRHHESKPGRTFLHCIPSMPVISFSVLRSTTLPELKYIISRVARIYPVEGCPIPKISRFEGELAPHMKSDAIPPSENTGIVIFVQRTQPKGSDADIKCSATTYSPIQTYMLPSDDIIGRAKRTDVHNNPKRSRHLSKPPIEFKALSVEELWKSRNPWNISETLPIGPMRHTLYYRRSLIPTNLLSKVRAVRLVWFGNSEPYPVKDLLLVLPRSESRVTVTQVRRALLQRLNEEKGTAEAAFSNSVLKRNGPRLPLRFSEIRAHAASACYDPSKQKKMLFFANKKSLGPPDFYRAEFVTEPCFSQAKSRILVPLHHWWPDDERDAGKRGTSKGSLFGDPLFLEIGIGETALQLIRRVQAMYATAWDRHRILPRGSQTPWSGRAFRSDGSICPPAPRRASSHAPLALYEREYSDIHIESPEEIMGWRVVVLNERFSRIKTLKSSSQILISSFEPKVNLLAIEHRPRAPQIAPSDCEPVLFSPPEVTARKQLSLDGTL
eukprot:gnl/Chilomastix_cuspidata/2257.p1 GENE.gnl/Chilomastix_cuspidata/2257~~gnl/Chilomastix_cuspidata/2257.p1  ORF type:complete len:1446 (+),score=326.42 gnl/Chilomastix_cuspidata/2257:69-4406(+)